MMLLRRLPCCWMAVVLLHYSSLILKEVSAFPTGAGGCAGGGPAVGGYHLEKTPRTRIVQNGDLSAGGIEFSVGGSKLDPFTEGDSVPVYDLDTNYEVAVTGTQYSFKGALVRVEPMRDSAVFALTPDVNTGNASVCVDPVQGFTHVDGTFQAAYTGMISVSEPGDFIFDVTIVGINNATASLYAYDGFVVRFADFDSPPPTDTPTATPTTAAPTPVATTDAPTKAPIKTPTDIPTNAPTDAPVPTDPPSTPSPTKSEAPVSVSPVTVAPSGTSPVAPTDTPTKGPTIAPTEVPTDVPTDLPVVLTFPPTKSPTTVPVSPTEAPVAPTDAPTKLVTVPPTAAPQTEEPTIQVTPVPAEEVSMKVLNLEITFRGVSGDLKLEDRYRWRTQTEAWFLEFYNGVPNEQRRLRSAEDNYGVVRGSMDTTIIVSNTEIKDAGTLVVTYDQELSYRALLNAYGPLQYTTLPFRSASYNAEYSDLLKDIMAGTFAGMETPVGVPAILGPRGRGGSGAGDDGASLSTGAIFGIVIAAIVVLLVIAGCAYQRISRNKRPKQQELDQEAFSFGGAEEHPHEKVNGESSKNPSSNKGSGHDEEDIAVTPTGAQDDNSSSVNNREYVVYAPSGRLGLVLDKPSPNEAPVVYIIKEDSPLLEKIEVGDSLVAVDEVNIRNMSPTKASKLISKRSTNPVRKFTLHRAENRIDPEGETGGDDSVSQVYTTA